MDPNLNHPPVKEKKKKKKKGEIFIIGLVLAQKMSKNVVMCDNNTMVT